MRPAAVALALGLAALLLASAAAVPILQTDEDMRAFIADHPGRRILLCAPDRIGDCDLLDHAYEIDGGVAFAVAGPALLPDGASFALDGTPLAPQTTRRRLLEDPQGGPLAALNEALGGRTVRPDGSGTDPSRGRDPEVEALFRARGLLGGIRAARDLAHEMSDQRRAELAIHYAACASWYRREGHLQAELLRQRRRMRSSILGQEARADAEARFNIANFILSLPREGPLDA